MPAETLLRIWILSRGPNFITEYANEYNRSDHSPGRLVSDAKDVLFSVHNPVHFGQAAAKKVWYLSSGVRPYYSVAHNFYQIAWMAGIYFLSFHGWRVISTAPVNVFVLSVIVVNCALISISTVDWDNRFYIPMEPCIVLLAGGGGFTLMNWIKNKIFPGYHDK